MVVYWNRIEKEVVTEVISFKKFRLISEEATSGTPFVHERGTVTRFLSQSLFRDLLLEYSKFFLVTHGISC